MSDAVLKTPLNEAARALVLQLLAQAEAELARARDAHTRLQARRRARSDA